MASDYRVLVALDGSERAPGVLAAAIDVARARKGELVVLRAVGLPLEVPAAALFSSPNDVPALLRGLAEVELEHLAKDVPRELLVAKRVRIGVPWEAIIEEASACGADLIVIGSHGYHGLDRVLGTTAGRVVNHAPCSTLVVRDKRAPVGAEAARA
jgi:nucleotide-binding universal stress UspA family protein